MKALKNFSPTARAIIMALAGAGAGGAALFYVFFFGPISLTTPQPAQPIAFSHRLHAGDNKIPCLYCHPLARRAEIASVPSAQICMNCHLFVKPEAPEVVKAAAHFESGKPVEWLKVFDLPDHVWFNHKRHIAKGFACQQCHGPVETMDVVYRANNFPMGFCLDCHQRNEAPTDCWTCHT